MLGLKTYSEAPISTLGDIADLVGAFPKFTAQADLDAFVSRLKGLGINIVALADLEVIGDAKWGAIVDIKSVADLDVRGGERQIAIANFNGQALLYVKGTELGEGWVRVVPEGEQWDNTNKW